MRKRSYSAIAILMTAVLLLQLTSPVFALNEGNSTPSIQENQTNPTAQNQNTVENGSLQKNEEYVTEKETQEAAPAADTASNTGAEQSALSTQCVITPDEKSPRSEGVPQFVSGSAPGEIRIKETSGSGWPMDRLGELATQDFAFGEAFLGLQIKNITCEPRPEAPTICDTIVLTTEGKVRDGGAVDNQYKSGIYTKGTVMVTPKVFQTGEEVVLKENIIIPSLTYDDLKADGEPVDAIPVDAKNITGVLRIAEPLENFVYFRNPSPVNQDQGENDLAYIVLQGAFEKVEVILNKPAVTGIHKNQIPFTLKSGGELAGNTGTLLIPREETTFDKPLAVEIPIGSAEKPQSVMSLSQDNTPTEEAKLTEEGTSTVQDNSTKQSTVQANLVLSNLKVNGSPRDTLNSNQTKNISGTLEFKGDKADWYVKNLAGEKNVLNTLQGGVAFNGAEFKKIEVRKNDPSKIDFMMDLETDEMTESMGTITIPKIYNRTGEDVSASAAINLVTLTLRDTGITIDNPQAEKEVFYTIKVAINGGKLKKKLKETDISFDRAFSRATVTKVTTDSGLKNFEVQIKKAANTSAGQEVQGNLYLKENLIGYDGGGQTVTTALSLGLSDQYRPSVVSENSDGNVMFNGQKLGNDVTKKATSNTMGLIKDSLSGTAKKAFPFFGSIFDLFVDLFSGGYSKSMSGTDKSLKEIKSKLEKIDTQIDGATITIIQNSNKNQMLSYLEKVSDSATNLKVSYADYYNKNALKAIEQMTKGSGDLSEETIRGYMQAVYSSDKNFNYLNEFKKFGYQITGEGVIFSEKDIFTVYEGIETYTCNWNTQTLERRNVFNKNVSSFYGQEYLILRTAIQYDHDYQQSLLNEYGQVINEINTIKNTTTDLRESEKELLDKAIKNYEEKSRAAKDGIQQDKDQLRIIDDTFAKVTLAGSKAQKKLEAEETGFKNGDIINYRLNRTFKSNIECIAPAEMIRPSKTSVSKGHRKLESRHIAKDKVSANKNPGILENKLVDLTGVPTEENYVAMDKAAKWRGITLYDDLISAGFKSGASALSDKVKEPNNLGLCISQVWNRTGGLIKSDNIKEVKTITDPGGVIKKTEVANFYFLYNNKYNKLTSDLRSADKSKTCLVLKEKGFPETGYTQK